MDTQTILQNVLRDQCHGSNFKLLRAVIREKLPLGKAWYSSSTLCGFYVSKIMAFFIVQYLGKVLLENKTI